MTAYLSASSDRTRTERVLGITRWNLLFLSFLNLQQHTCTVHFKVSDEATTLFVYLSFPGTFQSVRRDQNPLSSQRIVADVLVFSRFEQPLVARHLEYSLEYLRAYPYTQPVELPDQFFFIRTTPPGNLAKFDTDVHVSGGGMRV